MRLVIYSLVASVAASCLLVLGAIGCARHVEATRYTSQTLPEWILVEWEATQEELLRLPDITGDPRTIDPYRFEWTQMKGPFLWHNATTGDDEIMFGVYSHDDTVGRRQIIVCCGFRWTVRHEAAHAILHQLGDPRYRTHYPELLEMLQ